MVDRDLISSVMPNNNNPELWANLLNEVLEEYEINSVERIAAFISQTSHESLDYTALVENLNYSARGLRGTFGKYFTESQALAYQRKPQSIASRVYANRMGNSDEQSGDGWLYRGRGIVGVTGKNNYAACSQFIFESDVLISEPHLLEEPIYALRSGCWYWSSNNLNLIADTGDVAKLTRRINGGQNGLSDRIERYNKVIDYFNQ